MTAPKKNINKEIIALFSGQSATVTTPKLYINLTGNHSLAIVLNQCVFWSNKSASDDGWFYKKYDEWYEEVHIPERTLRRRFDRLEKMGWISTKVKKVKGENVKHIYTHTDRIIESISNMLTEESPNRPNCPARTNNEQNTCTNSDPTGQLGRLEPATLSDSTIYTEEDSQMKLTNCTPSSSFLFSESLDLEILSQKLCADERSDSEFMENVIDHIDNHSDKQYSRIVRAQAAIKLLRKLKLQGIVFYSKGMKPIEPVKETKKKNNAPFTQEELELVQQYKHARQMEKIGQKFETFMPSPTKARWAEEIMERIQAMEAKTCKRSTDAGNGSLTSVSSLVARLDLSRSDS